ncbi:MAG TPA: non-homologous end-joining DNA ligase [Marmoricola sp.]
MQPMLATRGDTIPPGPDWVHEVKWDGIRLLVEIDGDRVRASTRNENDVTAGFPELQALAGAGSGVLLDGEMVVIGEGAPSFGAVVERVHVRERARAERLAAAAPATLLAFDLLRHEGDDVTRLAWEQRRGLLEGLSLDGAACQVPPTYDDGASLMAAVAQQGLEGIVSKRRASLYHPGRRSRDWLKFPIRPTGSYVVGGFRFETGSDRRLGAVLVGQPGRGGLEFRGRVGSGLAGRAGATLLALLAPLAEERSPFASDLPRADREGTLWVRPEVIVDVQYLAVTGDGRLRQPAYRGVRSDLDPDDLVRPPTELET